MPTDETDTDPPTRRDCVKYSGTLLAAGLLAGCSGDDGGAQSTPTADPPDAASETATPTETATATEQTPHSVTMEPMGEVTFEAVPETWLSFLSTYGDMGIALGQGDGLRGLWNAENVPTAFYDNSSSLRPWHASSTRTALASGTTSRDSTWWIWRCSTDSALPTSSTAASERHPAGAVRRTVH